MVPVGYGLMRPGNTGSLRNLIVEQRFVAQISSIAQPQSDELERIDANAYHGIEPRANQARVVRDSPAICIWRALCPNSCGVVVS
jgi:hypothetical protein